jgi:hypothetical protein
MTQSETVDALVAACPIGLAIVGNVERCAFDFVPLGTDTPSRPLKPGFSFLGAVGLRSIVGPPECVLEEEIPEAMAAAIRGEFLARYDLALTVMESAARERHRF